MIRRDRWAVVVLFFLTFGVYLTTASPHLPPYRDAGEMAVAASTLGVPHAPGYPLYVLFGKAATMIPFGTAPYRVNILSALSAAGAVGVLFLLLRVWMGALPAAATVLLYAFTNPFWELSGVTEMYTLGVLWLSLLLYSAFALNNLPLTAFLGGLGLGIRMDLLLLAPVFAGWFAWTRTKPRWRDGAIFFAAGLSIFLFMRIRSRANPVLDWSNPETLGALFRSLSRASYGRTLDLLSLKYKKGANFIPGLSHFLVSFGKNAGLWSFVSAAGGAVLLFRIDRRIFFVLLSGFIITGPIYLFLANMPPNPHALAILEAAYPVPFLFLLLFSGFAWKWMFEISAVKRAAAVLAPVLIVLCAWSNWARADNRDNFYSRDYALNVLRSAPQGAVLALHEDVQLFSLWDTLLLEKKRPDLSLVSIGLSASPWYWEMLRRWERPPVPAISLKSDDGWPLMEQETHGQPLLAGNETKIPMSPLTLYPQGLLIELSSDSPARPAVRSRVLNDLCVYRGRYRYNDTKDFFTSDLTADYARAYHRQGVEWMEKGRLSLSDRFFEHAESLDPTFAQPTLDRGYIAFQSGDYERAYVLFSRALRKGRAALDLAATYKSLPDVVKQYTKDYSEAGVYAGAAAEKLGDKKTARNLYREAFEAYPNPKAHYNFAVTYWNEDWETVIRHLSRVVELQPSNRDARRYLAIARSKR